MRTVIAHISLHHIGLSIRLRNKFRIHFKRFHFSLITNPFIWLYAGKRFILTNPCWPEVVKRKIFKIISWLVIYFGNFPFSFSILETSKISASLVHCLPSPYFLVLALTNKSHVSLSHDAQDLWGRALTYFVINIE